MRWFGRSRGHGRWEARLAAFADGELPPDEDAACAAHLHVCEACRQALAAERALKGMLKAALPDVPAPRSFAIGPGMLIPELGKQPAKAAPPVLAMRFAQVAAGFAVIGLVSLFVLDLRGSDEGAENGAAAPMSAGDSAPGSDGESAGSLAPGGTPGGQPTPGSESLPAYDSGGVSGQGVEMPPPASETPVVKSFTNGGAPATGDEARESGAEDRDDPRRTEGTGEAGWLRSAQVALALLAAGSLVAYFAIRKSVSR